MIDISWYMATASLKRKVMDGALIKADNLYDAFEQARSRNPVVFNIETTNACNMRCPFCPRTTKMTRPVKTMHPEVFARVVEQMIPHSDELWERWCRFAFLEYGVDYEEQSENAFFLYILPRVVVLHGYGDPLLDKHIPDYVGMLTERGIPSYFSCNPSNIDILKLDEVMWRGLDYIKFSIDSTSESVRGRDSFERDFANIMQVLHKRDANKYKTQVIITMIDTGRQEFDNLKQLFKGSDVYIYQKSLDQAWMLGRDAPKSIHWSEPCQFPWSSLSVNSSGQVVPCGEDYDADMVLGEVTKDSLYDIWNSDRYELFRWTHLIAPPGSRCIDSCDMWVYGKWLKG